MKQIEENKEVHGYIKGDFIVLHYMDYGYTDENGNAINVPKLSVFNPKYIENICDNHYYGGTIIVCQHDNYTHICESVEEILDLLEEFKNKKDFK